MSEKSIVPEGEAFRHAIEWLGKQPDKSSKTIEQACQMFDLSPVDEEFLLQHFVQKSSTKN